MNYFIFSTLCKHRKYLNQISVSTRTERQKQLLVKENGLRVSGQNPNRDRMTSSGKTPAFVALPSFCTDKKSKQFSKLIIAYIKTIQFFSPHNFNGLHLSTVVCSVVFLTLHFFPKPLRCEAQRCFKKRSSN